MTRLSADIVNIMTQAVANVTFSRGTARTRDVAVTKRKTTTTKTTA